MDFTVAICTYNGEKRLPEVLDALLEQQETEGIKWEVLVVDNNSKDSTAAVVFNYARQWRSDSQLRYVFEKQQGTALARVKAFQEAQSRELVGFLDDDNIPGKTWIAQAYRFGSQNPQVGAYGGNIHAKLDSPPPSYFNQVKIYLTIYNRGKEAFCYHRNAKSRKIPAGPGCVFRKQAWYEVVPNADKLLVAGRDPKTLASGEDAALLYAIQNTQWELWHNPHMEIWHHIAPHRLEQTYLRKLARGYGLSQHRVRMARYDGWQRLLVRLLLPLLLLRESLQTFRFYLQHRKSFQKDFSKLCELEAKIGRLYGPFLT
ncbi:hormogonium polysaccharide biosynthesis glycosyltransferase HpsE [Geitlerinema sp. PCC 9228]|uniref:hormogonium polysaccharide biosynthesis glycosyltransferase HpsE n=1 Tax=Geitlerinema sp. PCC 9228 TaxID=111611 RepID=UPI0008F99772|nr:hormogonium polysaccharide biosynthesis glycosyltransferase HpsE [Geitlerinema sp. PCC 9228]